MSVFTKLLSGGYVPVLVPVCVDEKIDFGIGFQIFLGVSLAIIIIGVIGVIFGDNK